MFTSRAITAHRPVRQNTSWLLLLMFVAIYIDHVLTSDQGIIAQLADALRRDGRPHTPAQRSADSVRSARGWSNCLDGAVRNSGSGGWSSRP